MAHGKGVAKAIENRRKSDLTPIEAEINSNKWVKRAKVKDAVLAATSKAQGKSIRKDKTSVLITDSNNSAQQVVDSDTDVGNFAPTNKIGSNPEPLHIKGGNHGKSKQTKVQTCSVTRSLVETDEFNNFDKMLSDNYTELANDEDGVVVGVRALEDEFESDSEDEDHDRSRPDTSVTKIPQENTQRNDGNDPIVGTSGVTSLTRNAGSSNDLQEMLLNQLVNEQVKRQLAEEKCKAAKRAIAEANLKSLEKSGQVTTPEKVTTPKQAMGKDSTLLKSPSDTTIYAPLLSKISNVNDANALIDQISNFVENIRVEEQTSWHGSPGVGANRLEKQHASPANPTRKEQQQTRTVSDQLIVEAEKFKASVAAPQGEFNLLTHFKSELDVKRFLNTDDDFFHVSCHIDQSLRSKIEQGGFVDLERLLPRDRTSSRGSFIKGDRLSIDLVSREGHTYLAPAQSHDIKIDGIKWWEQAFQIYAAIYRQANPDRASEIWQYIYTINLAASSYNWENVAFYNFTFRQLMAEKPWRSWARTYTQGWNLALRDGSINKSLHNTGPSSNDSNFVTGGRREWKDDSCWWFNKDKCKKSNQECAFDHRCTYCGVWNHSFYNCRKRLGKTRKGGNNNAGRTYYEDGGTGPSSHDVNPVGQTPGVTSSKGSKQ